MLLRGAGRLLVEGPVVEVGVPAAPVDPDPWEPPPLPTQPGAAGVEWCLLVCDWPSGARRGVIWDARIDSWSRSTYGAGPGSLRASVPSTASNLAVLGTDPLRIELAVVGGGVVRERYVARQPWSSGGGVVRIDAQTHDVLLNERVCGPPGRVNLAPPIRPGLPGWHSRGGASAVAVAGGPAGSHFMRVTGPPGAYMAAAVRQTSAPIRWVQVPFGAAALVRVPAGDWDQYQLVSVHIWDRVRGRWAWPPEDGTSDGEFADSMDRGVWLADEVQAEGLTPAMPFDVTIEIRLHALPGVTVDYAAPSLGRPLHDGLAFPPGGKPDLSDVVDAYIAQAQDTSAARRKSSWGLKTLVTRCGVAENILTPHEERRSLPEALARILDRDDGPEFWWEGRLRRFAVAPRRGRVRRDVAIYPWDVIGPQSWEVDPGAQLTALHALSSASTQYGGGDVGVIDTTSSGGQVIEATVQAPDGLTRNEAAAWARGQLKLRSKPQITARLMLPLDQVLLLEVGDTLEVHLRDGDDVLDEWLRVTGLDVQPERGIGVVDVGTDPERGGV